jgi:hypothetical protein
MSFPPQKILPIAKLFLPVAKLLDKRPNYLFHFFIIRIFCQDQLDIALRLNISFTMLSKR